MNLAEAESIVAQVCESGRTLGVAYYRRAYPKIHRARELIRRGAIGQPEIAARLRERCRLGTSARIAALSCLPASRLTSRYWVYCACFLPVLRHTFMQCVALFVHSNSQPTQHSP
jgi:hypothetical protein